VKLVFFDLETGGLELLHPIIQIAAIAVDRDYQMVEEFEAKLTFNVADADPEALKVNSYDADIWGFKAEHPSFVVRVFSDFLKRHSDVEMVSKRSGRPYKVARLAGYNCATFDNPRLQKLFKDWDSFLPAHPQSLDVMQLAAWTYHGRQNRPENLKLSTVHNYLLDPAEGAHDALVDVRMTIAVTKALLAGGTRPETEPDVCSKESEGSLVK
jgi:DNA polymerase III epsilon subunit-like protein